MAAGVAFGGHRDHAPVPCIGWGAHYDNIGGTHGCGTMCNFCTFARLSSRAGVTVDAADVRHHGCAVCAGLLSISTVAGISGPSLSKVASEHRMQKRIES